MAGLGKARQARYGMVWRGWARQGRQGWARQGFHPLYQHRYKDYTEKGYKMTSEAKVKKKVRETLKALGAYYVMPVTSGYGASGAPDFLVCWKGLFFGIECKAGKNTTTVLQDLNIKAIRAAGGKAVVINEDNAEQLGPWMRVYETIST